MGHSKRCKRVVSGLQSSPCLLRNGARLVLLSLVMIAALIRALPAPAGAVSSIRPGPKDKCPVCGMFVSKYPDWTAFVVFRDGSVAFFDGPKDLFTFSFNMQKYAPGKQQSDVESIFVNEYYDVKPLDARTAWYVIGSDVNGPMGKELIPFKSEAEAREFMKDHQGTKALRFRDITPEAVAAHE